MLFDSHCHLNFSDFDPDRDEILKKCREEGIWMANVGTDYESSKGAVALAGKYDQGVYATIGVHPADNPSSGFDDAAFAGLITDRVVAVGETGLDYFHLPKENPDQAKQFQKELFEEQIAFAQKNSLPLVIHCRDAYEDLLEILKANYSGEAIIHSFTDSYQTAKKFLDLGFYIALNGILMFDKSGRLAEVCKNMPSDRILTETDAPFLSPPPHRGKRNEPLFVRYIAEKIAEIRSANSEEIFGQIFTNACRIYGIKNPTS